MIKIIFKTILIIFVFSIQAFIFIPYNNSVVRSLPSLSIDMSNTIVPIDIVSTDITNIDNVAPDDKQIFDLDIDQTTIKELTSMNKEINEDVLGWIYIPDTIINYPILYREGDDLDFYLTHNIYKEEDKAGAIYLDASSKGVIHGMSLISGHSMNNKTMFGNLLNYKIQDWADAHRDIYIYDGIDIKKYKVFACVLFNANNERLKVDFNSMYERLNYLEDIKNRSMITTFDIKDPLDILILNTCSYEADNFRCLIFGFVTEINGVEK